MSVPFSPATVYTHDELNRLDTVTDVNSQKTTYGYDAVGNLETVALPNGVASIYFYNAVNRLTGLSTRQTSTGALLAGYTYGLNPSGHRRAAFDTGTAAATANAAQPRTAAYDYDAHWRLSGESISGAAGAVNGSLQYTYDAVGNRRARQSTVPGLPVQNFAFDANDRLAGDAYDDNGNTVLGTASQPAAPAGGTLAGTDSYDGENRLTRRQGAAGSVTIVYDGDGNKVRETVVRDGVTKVTSYLVDDLNPTGYAQVLEEKTDGTLTRVNTFGHAIISQDQLSGGDWSLSYYGYDGHGSVRFLTDQNGRLTDTYDYDAFGELLRSGGTTPNTYRYCGEQFDSVLGLYFLRARMMNPLTGRFWSADSYEGTQEDPLSLHKYLYCASDPVSRIDPSGNTNLLEILAGLNTTAKIMIFAATFAIAYMTVDAIAPTATHGVLNMHSRPPAVWEQLNIKSAINELIDLQFDDEKNSLFVGSVSDVSVELDDHLDKHFLFFHHDIQGLTQAFSSSRIIVSGNLADGKHQVELKCVIYAEYQHLRLGNNEPDETKAQLQFERFLAAMNLTAHPVVSKWRHGGIGIR